MCKISRTPFFENRKVEIQAFFNKTKQISNTKLKKTWKLYPFVNKILKHQGDVPS